MFGLELIEIWGLVMFPWAVWIFHRVGQLEAAKIRDQNNQKGA